MAFDASAVFDADYLYFYADMMAPEKTAAQVELIVRLLGGTVSGQKILDVACGHGRIANGLAEHGGVVTGVDASAFFIDQARADANTRGVNVNYVHGDMRQLSWRGEFDAVVNWFTAFGYFSDDTDRLVLRDIAHTLRPGGRFIIEHLNRDRVLANFLPSVVVERDGDFMIDRSRYDVDSGRIYTDRVIVRDGKTRRFAFDVRLFTVPELRDWLLAAGFSRVTATDETGGPVSLTSRRVVMVAERAAE